jgi:hypothetical protein
MATQNGKNARSSGRSRPSGKSRSSASTAAHPGQQSRRGESAAGRRNPDAAPSGGARTNGRARARARGGPAEQAFARRQQQREAQDSLVNRATEGVRAVGTRAAQSARELRERAAEGVKQHPTAVNVVGASLAAAGIALLAARAMMNSGQEDDDSPGLLDRAGEALGGAMDSVREGTSKLGEYGREGISRAGEAIREGASAVGSGAEQGYAYTKDKLGDLWDEHPLAMGMGLVALGLVAGMMIPSTSAEQSLLGHTASRVTRRAKSAGGTLLKQGKKLAENVITNTGEAVRDAADWEALAPDKIARKVKRFAGRVKDAVSDAFDD